VNALKHGLRAEPVVFPPYFRGPGLPSCLVRDWQPKSNAHLSCSRPQHPAAPIVLSLEGTRLRGRCILNNLAPLTRRRQAQYESCSSTGSAPSPAQAVAELLNDAAGHHNADDLGTSLPTPPESVERLVRVQSSPRPLSRSWLRSTPTARMFGPIANLDRFAGITNTITRRGTTTGPLSEEEASEVASELIGHCEARSKN